MVYLDNNATTQIDRQVYHKQCEVLNKFYGNPSSMYPYGIVIKDMLQTSRQNIASLVGCDISLGDTIIFTSCASESNNSVFFSTLQKNLNRSQHIVISAIEHPSVLKVAEYYKSIGVEVTYVQPNSDGIIEPDKVIKAITNNTCLVSIMFVNGETGVIQPIEQIAKQVKEINNNILFHTDAVQAAGKLDIYMDEMPIDFLTISGHKFHAPKGVGALIIKRGIQFNSFIKGGHQEDGLRAGTENTASIVAMGEAARLAIDRLKNDGYHKIKELRDYMEKEIKNRFPESLILGLCSPRVGNTSNIGFKDQIGSTLVLKMAAKGFCISSGTACNSSSSKPSYVLSSMKVPDEYLNSVRISLSHYTTRDEIDAFIDTLGLEVQKNS